MVLLMPKRISDFKGSELPELTVFYNYAHTIPC